VNPLQLQYGVAYHIYNRGNNRENVFVEERNYRHFLQLYAKYIEPVAWTYAYCLLRNHFHFLVKIKLTNAPGLCFNDPLDEYPLPLRRTS
jgi:putative transposase